MKTIGTPALWRRIQVFEHETLGLTPNMRGECLTEVELDRLWAFNDQHGNIYFKGVRSGIQFANFVGVIQVGGLTLEILPKADRETVSDPNSLDRWQKALVQMLKVCGHLKIETVSEADLAKRHHSLLDLYVDIFLKEVEYLQRRGLIKQYHLEAGNVRSLKGKLMFAQQVRQNLVHAERFYTEHQVYDHDHLCHQILLRALDILSGMGPFSMFRDRIARLRTGFEGIRERLVTEEDFSKLQTSRKLAHYDRALKVARMIILNFMPDVQVRSENMLALLFDMNKLWEDYVYRMICRAAVPGWRVSSQERQRFWENKLVRPDIVLRYLDETGQTQTFVIDTKWKIVDSRQPSDDDLKQMYVYNLYWGASRSLLLYPQVGEQEETFGNFHRGRADGENACKVGFVRVLEDWGRLDMDLGQKVLEKLGIDVPWVPSVPSHSL